MRTAVLITLLVISVGCGSGEDAVEPESGDTEVAKVRAYGVGRITVDGSSVSVDDLPALFQDLKRRGGVVWYYREAGSAEPHPNAMAVIEAVVEAGLPVSMSSEEDFSTVVLPDGATQPRQ